MPGSVSVSTNGEPGQMYQLLYRIEERDGTSSDLDLLLELGGTMGIMPGTTICGLADSGN